MYELATAPISWGICDVPGWGVQLDSSRVLQEMSALGITATEIGPFGFLPTDSEGAKRVLNDVGMRAVGSYDGFVLHKPGWQEQLRATAEQIRGVGGDTLVFSVLAGPGDYSGDAGIDDSERVRILESLDKIADLEEEIGLTLAVHPHLGSLIETPADIDWMLEGSNVRVCLDTGHVYAAGGDVVNILSRIGSRLAHIHLKDADEQLSAQLRAGEIDFLTAVRRGIFRSLGQGALDISTIVRTLRDNGYDRWLVLEQDVMLEAEPTANHGPHELVQASIEFLRSVETN